MREVSRLMITVFFAYSHRDEALRDELETHLSMLKRQGVIETWHDRRIGAGKEINQSISCQLEESQIILLLVSSYFLDSDYCYDVEMQRAMEKHENGSARVIPVILRPCDWHYAPFGKLNAVPKDGKPITKYADQHEAFLEVARAVRDASQEMGQRPNQNPRRQPGAVAIKRSVLEKTQVRSSNLRIKKRFSDREKDKFLKDAFEYIANFFDGSLAELRERNPEIDTDFTRIDANHFTAAIYVNGSIASRSRIWLGGRHAFHGGIAYSSDDRGNDNSFNESLSVEDDGYSLFLKPLGVGLRQSGDQTQLTYQGGAEYLWGIFMEPLQR